ncbi:MAG: hypothetical protein IKG57_09530 [Enterococcus sp.]|uniref:hypothetical protein n=1 Tax=Enterococcus sp. TaxID=35783 RepID=UPI00257E7B5C|nr:hypothetical protein [Enterococcus sp.]MBR3048396.1 hypothetical protein [Enterococcus sp.]
MKDLSHAVKEINVPDIVQEKAQNAFARIQEESRMSKNSNVRRRFFMSPALAAAAIVAVVLIGGGVVWASNGGLAGFLSKFMPEEEVNGRLDTPSENEIKISQSEGEDYGPLWTIEEYWYDGATLYFSATAPQKVIDAGNLLVEASDHADVNGTDCQLSFDGCWDETTGEYTGHYICYVDLSNADTSSGNVSIVIRLRLKQYKIMPVFFVAQENNEVETITEQKLHFDFEKPNDARQLREENLSVEGGVADINVTVAPSMFKVSIVYQLNDSSKSIKDIVKYRITDSSGNSTTVWVYGIDSDDNCVTIFMTDLEGLDPNASYYTFEPVCFQFDSEGERVPDAFDPLGWGGFTVVFK